MNDAPNISYYTAGTATPVEIDGAVVLKGVIAVAADTGYGGLFLEFKNGGSGGDVLYKIQLVLDESSENYRIDGGASKIAIPGSGIRFDSGLYFEPTADRVEAITIIYQGGSVG